MVSSAVEKNEAGKGMQDRISSDVLNPVVRESLHVKATRAVCESRYLGEVLPPRREEQGSVPKGEEASQKSCTPKVA